jgi:hypothetical protein
MATVSEIALAARELSLEEQRALLNRLALQVQAEESKFSVRDRTFGLGRGKTWMSEDFNEPLPDDFWLGENAYTGEAADDPAR